MAQKSRSKKQPKPQRTTLMTVALVLVILHGLFMAAFYWTTRQNMGGASSFALSALLICAVADVVAGYGMWNWKRWGIYLYAAATVVQTIVILMETLDVFLIFGSIVPAIVVAYILLPKRNQFK
jgi:drug/metabolite transporter (DMT)-like permease